jgi:nicotinate-nucleotide adenylyltransferase
MQATNGLRAVKQSIRKLASCVLDFLSRVVIGILGGTFDPIHYGHLRPAAQVLTALDLEEIRFIPAARPPHRRVPAATFAHRLRMVGLAVTENPRFRVDEREMRIPGPSYTVHTLESLRGEYGSRSICLLMGSDAFRELESWYQWERLLELSHIVVMQRPDSPTGAQLPSWVENRLCRDKGELSNYPGGRVLIQHVDPQNISASKIRAQIASGQSVAGLLPDVVYHYIQKNHLYGYNSS